jgi:hypothetical protein
METAIKVLRTWEGGPLRQMAIEKASNAFIPFAISVEKCNYAGRYVCEGCNQPVNGLSLRSLQNVGKNLENRPFNEPSDLQGWICDLCERGGIRKVATEAQKHAVIDRLAAVRAARIAEAA